MHTAEDDRRLLARVERKDQLAMTEIFDRYSGMAYSIALRVLRDPAQAEDVVQDVFLQIWLNPASFVPERGALCAWLAVVIRNRSIDALRKRKPSEPVEDVMLPAANDVFGEAEINSVMARVRAAAATLPAEQRESLELAYFDGMTHTEIAERQKQPLGTVKTRIRTALLSLRKAVS